MHEPLIEVRSLDHRFGPRPALSGVDLIVGPGEIHGLIGPSGAGKSTLLRVLAGALTPSAGLVWSPARTALVASEDSEALSPLAGLLDDAARRRIALARALADEPDVLLIDEPAADLGSETVAATRALAARHAIRGGAVVWATRRLDHLQGLASGVTLLAAGRVRFAGPVEVLVSRALAGSAPSPVVQAA